MHAYGTISRQFDTNSGIILNCNQITVTKSMIAINREGRKKREMRNLLRRGRIWYFKKMVEGKVLPVSLNTDDVELAKAKRNLMERQAMDKEWDKIKGPRSKVGTLEKVFEQFKKAGGITEKALGAYVISMMTVCRIGLDDEKLQPADVKLDKLTPKLVRDYQDKVRAQYELAAGLDEKAKRIARDRADRTSKSTIGQAKCIFGKKRQLIDRYKESGIAVPDCVEEFRTAGAVGEMTTKVYFPASDAVVKETFAQLPALREVDPEAWLIFWLALGTGCRRNELADMKVSDMIEIDGRLWVGAGLGKDGKPIHIPVIDWPVRPEHTITPAQVLKEALARRRTEAGADAFILQGSFTERYDEMPDRLNAWMQRMGWNDEKKLHALRAFIGCKLYAKNPRLAQLYLRHKSIATTENYYAHFLALHGAFDFLPVVLQPPAVQASGRTSEGTAVASPAQSAPVV